MTPPHIKMGTILAASIPFLIMQCIGLAACVIFPAIITYFPKLVYGKWEECPSAEKLRHHFNDINKARRYTLRRGFSYSDNKLSNGEEDMRILFIGQAPFGKEALESLLTQGEEIVGVITVPDAANQKYPNPVKECSEAHGLPLFQSKLLKTEGAISWVRGLKPDLLVLAFVTSFVPQEMIDLARFGGINYHPSLLPKYRGGSAINWAVINGETETGVTIHFIDEGVDSGPILLQERVVIEPDDTVKSVYFNKLYPLGIRMLGEAVKLVRTGKAAVVEQDDSLASFQPVITPDDTIIDWGQPTEQIYNLIRGANPAPGGVTSLHGQSCKVFDAQRGIGSGAPGTVIGVGEQSFTVATGDGAIEVHSSQPPNSKKLPAPEFVQTTRLKVGDRFGN